MSFDRLTLAEKNAWIAGFIDGEGSIGIYAANKTYSLTLYVGQKVRAPLDRLVQMYGGHVTWNEHRGKRGGLWDWKLHGRRAALALEGLLPYLSVKREQALLAIKFQDCLQSSPARQPLSEADLGLRRRFYEEMRRLKTVEED